MRRINILAVAGLALLLVACDPKIDVKMGCQLLEAAGINHGFHLSAAEKKAITLEHKRIIYNLQDWYASHC